MDKKIQTVLNKEKLLCKKTVIKEIMILLNKVNKCQTYQHAFQH